MLAHRRAGAELRRKARQRTIAASRSPLLWVGFAALAIVVGAVVVGDEALLSLSGHRLGGAASGFLLGGVVCSIPWAVWGVITRFDGSWSWRTGAEAERWTAEALRRLGPCWRLQYNMVFYKGGIESPSWVSDIDCVASGPAGVLAVSTKWTGDHWDLSNPSDEWLVAAARQAARDAEKLARQVRQLVHQPAVIPVVVCWGPQLRPINGAVSKVYLGGTEVLVLYGPQSNQWLGTFIGKLLSEQQVREVDDMVGQWIATYESRRARAPLATERAKSAARRARRTARAAVAVDGVAAIWLVAATINHDVLRAFDRFVRLGGGLVGTSYLLLPIIFPAASAALAYRAMSVTSRARLRLSCRTDLVISVVTLAGWLVTFIAVWAVN